MEPRRREHATANEPQRFCCSFLFSQNDSHLILAVFVLFVSSLWFPCRKQVYKRVRKLKNLLITPVSCTQSQGSISSSAALHKPHVSCYATCSRCRAIRKHAALHVNVAGGYLLQVREGRPLDWGWRSILRDVTPSTVTCLCYKTLLFLQTLCWLHDANHARRLRCW